MANIERIRVNTDSIDRIFHEARYNFAASFCIGKMVGDIACGVGYGSKILKANGAKKVIGFDTSPEAIGITNNQKTKGHSFIKADIENTTLQENIFDIVISFETIEHLKDQQKFIENLYHSLKDGGSLILSTPNRNTLLPGMASYSPYHVNELYIEDLEHLLKDKFNVLNYYYQEYPRTWWRILFMLQNKGLRYFPPAIKNPFIRILIKSIFFPIKLFSQINDLRYGYSNAKPKRAIVKKDLDRGCVILVDCQKR